MEYEIRFHPAALKEFCELDGSVKKLVKKQVRIVYSVVENVLLVNIIAIGKREDMEVYQTASERT